MAGGHRLGRPLAGDRTLVGPRRARRRARFQLVTGDGAAWLAAVQDGRWQIEALRYRLSVGWDNPPVPWRELERRLSWERPAPRRLPAANRASHGR